MTVGLMAGAWRPCAGWKPTPEARMSCCMRKADCAKHKSAGGSGHAPHRQSDADACCAASERPDASPSLLTVVVPPTFVPLAGPFAEPPSVPARWFDFHLYRVLYQAFFRVVWCNFVVLKQIRNHEKTRNYTNKKLPAKLLTDLDIDVPSKRTKLRSEFFDLVRRV